MTRWIGRWLMAVAVLHTGVALWIHGEDVLAVIREGVFDTVAGNATNGAIVWSLLFGGLAFLGGIAVDALERSSIPHPAALGWGMMILATLGVVLVPVSGFWLLFPAAVGVLRRTRQG